MGATFLVLEEALDDRPADALPGLKLVILAMWWRRDVLAIILVIPCLSTRITLSSTINGWCRGRRDTPNRPTTIFAHHEDLKGGEICQDD